jgi:hypothetical protein
MQRFAIALLSALLCTAAAQAPPHASGLHKLTSSH